jgi:hypothetical protein
LPRLSRTDRGRAALLSRVRRRRPDFVNPERRPTCSVHDVERLTPTRMRFAAAAELR